MAKASHMSAAGPPREWGLFSRAGFQGPSHSAWPAAVDTRDSSAWGSGGHAVMQPPPHSSDLICEGSGWPPTPATGRICVCEKRRCGTSPFPSLPRPIQGSTVDRREKFFKLEVGGRPEVVSVDRLKPHLGRAPVMAASPPQRGCPKGLASGGLQFSPRGGWNQEPLSRKLRNYIVAYISLSPDLCASLLLMLSE
jgi:hypothetical protein